MNRDLRWIGKTCLICIVCSQAVYAGSYASIAVDGDPSDWAGIDNVVTDVAGNNPPQSDLLSIKIANDGELVYLLIEFAQGPPDGISLWLDTDLDSTTGFPKKGLGIEYVVYFNIGLGQGYLGDARNNNPHNYDFPGAVQFAVSGALIECSVRIAALEVLSPGLNAFDMYPQTAATHIARYQFAPVDDVPPTIESHAATPAVLPVGSPVTLGAVVSDNRSIAEIRWDFGDGGVFCPEPRSGVVTATHVYESPGIYTVTLSVADDSQNSAADSISVVVYDASAGFVTGGGWICSAPGCLTTNPEAEGRASFGFVSKYGSGAPTGQTEFILQAGSLNFHSSGYDWLVVNQGGTSAQFKGTGTIDGSGAYKFMLWAGDESPDTFRIKIWSESSGGAEEVVYDNGFSQPISGGSIVIHTK